MRSRLPLVATQLFIAAACGPVADQDGSKGHASARPSVNPETALVRPDAPISTGYHWNTVLQKMETVHYAEVNGLAVFQGDIVLGTVEEMEARTREIEAQGVLGEGGIKAQGVAVNLYGYFQIRWPAAVIPYTIDPALPDTARVTDAIRVWEASTRVRFVSRTATNAANYPNYVTFEPTPEGCFTSVGLSSGQRKVSLESGCSMGNTVHEIGHVLGLYHEQGREDRDGFVRILWENVIPGKESQFEKKVTYADDVLAYDYDSIMHYSAYAFSANGEPTIETLGGQTIGRRDGLSAGDIASIGRIYSIDEFEVFIQQTYLDVLKRAPETAGFRNAYDWLTSCNGNSSCIAETRVSMARGMLESAENRQQDPDLNPSSSGYNAAFVTHCYTNFLQRQPDSAGYSWWLNALNASGDYQGVVRGFITSSEYRRRFGAQ